MPEILIKNLFDRLVPFSKLNSSVLNAIHSEYIDWMHTCGAKGKCTTCKMRVLEGQELISPLSDAEIKFREMGKLMANERLACQCSIRGNIKIEVCDENKMPHLTYSE